jgi:pyruvate,water dikinase
MSTESCIKPFELLSRKDTPTAGGKGANLGDMVQAGLPVPPGFVICCPAFRAMMESNGLDKKIYGMLNALNRQDINQVREIEAPIRALIESTEIDQGLQKEIVEHYRALGENVPVAVRSSSSAEDLACASFAGQQETILNVVGEEALMQALKRCWSSLFTSQAIFYRHQSGFNDEHVSMAVVVQKMIGSEKSGVIFTVDPVTHNRYQMVIEGVWGLGEGIVSGAITPDHYKVDKETYEVMYNFFSTKTIMYVKDGSTGVRVLDVPPDLACLPVINENELKQLVDLGNRLEEHFACPQDVEWAVESGQVYLLQSRPITSL